MLLVLWPCVLGLFASVLDGVAAGGCGWLCTARVHAGAAYGLPCAGQGCMGREEEQMTRTHLQHLIFQRQSA